MKMFLMKCPHCGGQLEVEQGLESFFCKYCGTKILVDQTELRVKQMEHEERMADKETKRKSDKLDAIQTIVLACVALLVLVAFVSVAFILMK